MMTVGDIIRTNREEKGISQEDLSYGICSVSNLSRIENGGQIPSRVVYEAFMQRMGLDPEMFPSFLTQREVTAFRLKHEMSRCVNSGEYDKVEEMAEKLKREPKLEKVHKQYVDYIEAILFRRKGGDPLDVLNKMKAVLAISVRDFDETKILRHIFTKDELSILNNLAISYIRAGDEDKGIDIFYAVKQYIEKKVVDDFAISSMYTMILYNLSKHVGLRGRHNEVIDLCDTGIRHGVMHGQLLKIPGLLLNKGYALVMLGRKDEAKKYLQEAYYMDRMLNHVEFCEITKKFADEHGITI